MEILRYPVYFSIPRETATKIHQKRVEYKIRQVKVNYRMTVGKAKQTVKGSGTGTIVEGGVETLQEFTLPMTRLVKMTYVVFFNLFILYLQFVQRSKITHKNQLPSKSNVRVPR